MRMSWRFLRSGLAFDMHITQRHSTILVRGLCDVYLPVWMSLALSCQASPVQQRSFLKSPILSVLFYIYIYFLVFLVISHHLGNVFFDWKRYGEALPLYERALQIQKAALGDDHQNVAVSSRNLAMVLFIPVANKYYLIRKANT